MSRADVFERIYRTNHWPSDGTRAGAGSMWEATHTLRRDLPKLCEELGVTTLLEAGCNECRWQPDLPGYIGVDIVPEAIAVARELHPERTFMVADICKDPLPEADAILCRDVLQHLNRRDVLLALANFRRSARWLISGTWPDGTNRRATTGGFSRINLTLPPYNLGKPIRSIPDAGWWFNDGKLIKVADTRLDVWEL